ncbi:MAG: hypothetical protein HKN16_07155 [Saprospiraceae bacterium]|nr:hypothetical protein [Saprospiraceae bacterium]
MKAKISRILFLSILVLSAFSFIYLNLVGASSGAPLGEVFATDQVFQQADIKLAKFLLDQFQHFILHL